MRTKQIVNISTILLMIFLLPLSNVNAYTWKISDEICDVAYYHNNILQYEGCEHQEIDITSLKLLGSNIIVELYEDYPSNATNYWYNVYIIWEYFPENTIMSDDSTDTNTFAVYGVDEFLNNINLIGTTICDKKGEVDAENYWEQITHSGNYITIPIPLFEDLPFTIPEYAICCARYEPYGAHKGIRFIDELNGTFTRTPSVPGYTYWAFTTSSLVLLAIFICTKKRND